MITDHIYAYYAEIGATGQLELIDFWKERWAAEGWTPVILTEDDAKRHRCYDKMIAKAAAFPCINHRGFERSNFERWLAFAQIDGAVTDYDVFPLRPFAPRDFGGFVCFDPCGGPGFISGWRSDFEKVARLILSYEVQPTDVWQGNPHVSDMGILHRNRHIYDHVTSEISTYGRPGWTDLPLVHFGNACIADYTDNFRRIGKTQAVREILEKPM